MRGSFKLAALKFYIGTINMVENIKVNILHMAVGQFYSTQAANPSFSILATS